MRAIALHNAEEGQEVSVVLFTDDGRLIHEEDLGPEGDGTVEVFVPWTLVLGLFLIGIGIGWLICMWWTL